MRTSAPAWTSTGARDYLSGRCWPKNGTVMARGPARALDHLIRLQQYRLRDRQSKRLGGLEVVVQLAKSDRIDVEVVNRDIKTEAGMLKWLAVTLGIEGIQPPPGKITFHVYWSLRRPRVCRRSLAGVGVTTSVTAKGLPSPTRSETPWAEPGRPSKSLRGVGPRRAPQAPHWRLGAPEVSKGPHAPSPRVRRSTSQPRCISSGSSVSTSEAPPSA